MPTDAVRLAIISTHPIQYYAPLFRELEEGDGVVPHVFYGWHGPAEGAYDPGFGTDVTWDVPLLDGYAHTFVDNASPDPGTHHLRGLINPDLVPSVKAWGPDAVLIFGWNYWSHLQALRAFSGRVPVYFRGDSTLIDETPGLRQVARRMWLRWVYRHVDTALFVGTHNRDYYEAHGLGDDRLAWVPHAIDNRRFDDPPFDAEAEATAWRSDLGIPDEAPTAVFASKLSAKKAPEVLLDAFLAMDAGLETNASLETNAGSDARDRSGASPQPAPHLVIAGSGPLGDDLKARARAHPRVHFIGFQNQSRMPVVYRLGDVFVLPSRGPGETWGLAINEAMACGRAVIASTNAGCAPDLIEPEENGSVFEAGDSDALARHLAAVLMRPSRAAEMGRASKRRIQGWSIQAAARRLEAAVCGTTVFSY